jgi:protein O-mannosyl-transferase
MSAADPARSEGAAVWIALIGLAAIGVFLPSLGYGFLYDDIPQIVANSFLRSVSLGEAVTSPVWQGLTESPTLVRYVRPVFSAFLWWGARSWPQEPLCGHLAAVAIHLLVSLLLFGWLRRLTGAVRSAGWGALLFAVHPVHVESVAWISGVTDPLCAVFLVPAAWCWTAFRQTGGPVSALGSVTFFGLALLTKETAAGFPLAVLGSELAAGASRPERRRSLAIAGLCALVAAGWLGWRWVRFGGLGPPLAQHDTATLVATLPGVAGFYLGQLLLPLRVAPAHGLPLRSELDAVALLQLGALALAGVAALRLLRRSQARMTGAAWTAALLLPVLNLQAFLPGDALHDRYLYLPSLGSCALLGMLLAGAARTRSGRLGAATVVLLYAALSWRALPAYSSELALWRAAVASAPSSPKLSYSLAMELERRGEASEAAAWYRHALSAGPPYGLELHTLGRLESRRGRLARALALHRRAAEIDPDNAWIWDGLGDAWMRLRDAPRALRAYQRALALEPSSIPFRLDAAAAALALDPPDAGMARALLSAIEEPDLTEAVLGALEALRRQLGETDAAPGP